MIELSFDNVNNGLNRGIHMQCWCPTARIADDIFRRARDLYFSPGKRCSAKRTLRSLDIYGVHLRFKPWNSSNNNWRGFRGVHMIHPDLSMNFQKQKDFDLYDEMMFHNERYLDQWRA